MADAEDAPPEWVTAEVLAVLVDGSFRARIQLPDGSDQWDDWFTWEEEGKDWRRREHSRPPPKRWKWINEGDIVEVEIVARMRDTCGPPRALRPWHAPVPGPRVLGSAEPLPSRHPPRPA